MSKYRLSSKASEDVEDIAHYTIETWGIEQARTYRDGLHNCLEMLAENAQLGRDASEFAPNLRRFPYKAHTIFYIVADNEILIVRILYQGRDFRQHL